MIRDHVFMRASFVMHGIMLQHFQPQACKLVLLIRPHKAMAPMAMKSILKKGALGKAKAKPAPVGKFAALGKGKAVAKAKALAKGKALAKAKAKGKAKKLSKSNLEKLGELTLADKIKAAAELGGEDEEAAAAFLKDSLTPDENSQVWGRHQTFLKSNPLEKEDYLGKGKKEKGLAASLWLMQTAGKKFLSCRTSVGALEKVKKKDQWESEASMLRVWSEKELSLHLQSGRVIWRECPSAAGVWEYKDTQKYSRVVTGSRGSTWESGLEKEPVAEDLEKFESLYNEEAMSLHDSGFLLGKGKGKSLGKGSLGKGKPKKPRLLALQDGEVDPPQEENPRPGSRPARLRPWCTSFRGSWTKPWKRLRASCPERSRPQHWATSLP